MLVEFSGTPDRERILPLENIWDHGLPLGTHCCTETVSVSGIKSPCIYFFGIVCNGESSVYQNLFILPLILCITHMDIHVVSDPREVWTDVYIVIIWFHFQSFQSMWEPHQNCSGLQWVSIYLTLVWQMSHEWYVDWDWMLLMQS